MTTRSPVVAIPILAATLWCGATCARYEPEVWLQEFATLRGHMAAHYANLDWMVSFRKIDLTALTRETTDALRVARTEGQARKAVSRFIEAFGDPHLVLVDSAAPRPSSGKPLTEASCKERGYEARNRNFRFPFERAEGWKKAGGSWFPAGSFGDIGVIRIAHFGEDGYLEACEEVGPKRVRERLQDELRRTIGLLRERGIRVLVIDISGNGGGTEWAVEVTRLLTSKTLRRPGARESDPTCDRAGIWDGAPVCPVLGEANDSTMDGDGVWDGPLALLIDGGTASASEDMVVWLRESGAATIIGEKTYGAGCGYAHGGAPARLVGIGLTVQMPNCARFTSDGINEIEGIRPDVLLPLREGSAAERLRQLANALQPSALAAGP